MGWKSVKEHYRIDHTVQMAGGKLCIGSSYVHNLISVTPSGEVSTELFPTQNPELNRYYKEITSNKEKFVELLHIVDKFDVSLPIYTYSNGQVIKKFCEEYGWPNVTHDGEMIYENTFFKKKAQAAAYGKKDEESNLRFLSEHLVKQKNDLDKLMNDIAESKLRLDKLNTMFKGN